MWCVAPFMCVVCCPRSFRSLWSGVSLRHFAPEAARVRQDMWSVAGLSKRMRVCWRACVCALCGAFCQSSGLVFERSVVVLRFHVVGVGSALVRGRAG